MDGDKDSQEHAAWIVDVRDVGTPHGSCLCPSPTTAPGERQSGTPLRRAHQATSLYLHPAGLKATARTCQSNC